MAKRMSKQTKPAPEPSQVLETWMLDVIMPLMAAEHGMSFPQWHGVAQFRRATGPDGRPIERAQLEQLRPQLEQLGLPIEYTPYQVLVASPELQLAVLEQLDRAGRIGEFLRLGRHSLVSALAHDSGYPDPHLLRLAAVRMDVPALQVGLERLAALEGFTTDDRRRRSGTSLPSTFGSRPSAQLLELLPASMRAAYLTELCDEALDSLRVLSPAVFDGAARADDPALRLAYGRVAILRGEVDVAQRLGELPKHGAETLALLAAFARGDLEAAVAHGRELCRAMKTRKQKSLTSFDGAVHVLAELATSGADPTRLLEAERLLGARKPHVSPWSELLAICERLAGRLAPRSLSLHGVGWLGRWLGVLHDIWLEVELHDPSLGWAVDALTFFHARAVAGGYVVVARELAGAADALQAKPSQQRSLAVALQKPSGWELALAGLEQVAHARRAIVSETEQRRVVWELSSWTHLGFRLTPRLVGSKGKGRKVPLTSLGKDHADCLGDADRQLLRDLEVDRIYTESIMFSQVRALAGLVDHPRVVDADGQPLRIERGHATLVTRHVGDGVRVEVSPPELSRRQDMLLEAGPGRMRLFVLTPELRRLLDVVQAGIEVPAEGVDRLAQILTRLAAVAGIEITGTLEPARVQVDAESRPLLLLVWDGKLLTVRLRAAPFGVDGPHLLPGVGNVSLTTEVTRADQPELLETARELALERRLARELVEVCPTLASYATGPHDYVITELADALEVLLELAALGDRVLLAWPKGRVLHPPLKRDIDDLRVSIMSADAWLSIAAGLEIDDDRVLSFRALLASREGPRFVALGPDRFIALSERLRRQIDALADIGTVKGDELRASPGMLPVLEDLTDELEHVEIDAAAREQLDRLRELADAQPRLPRGFRAKLRDYQRDGFAWLWRRAEAGLGACLADDMGLGKTVQALALLLARARSGPSLVVCPTSVVHNWVAEAGRFAPSLRTIVLASEADRAARVAALGPRDLLICSYGVLVGEVEALASIEFSTAVFDEAHACKNDGTKRSAAARQIQAAARVGLTGTPIENRIEELWGVFRVLAPGLLGSKAHFDERFAGPIACGERAAAQQLRAIVRHFILRRTKAAVLDELPPRTDITVSVESSAAQQAFYEALRLRARERVAASDPQKKRFRVLAEINALRQAAVDPRLIDEVAAPPGAKLDAVLDHLQALRDEGHRALVFTQYLGSMALLRARLDAAGIEYLELDGSTPAAERARRVDAFQRGEADVFVLSLRAGGIGMNLTGADYVLHLDPWWNPAVEDQATDRAHRIGQTRPVTVYRFVSKGTIEEKIIALHEHKRGLADDMLAGLESSDALDLDELVALLDE